MEKKKTTIDTYNRSALRMAEKFDRIGARVEDISETLSLVDRGNPHVFEIGCGNGRDAQEILRHTTNYTGIDISEKLIELARERNPEGVFFVQDIERYEFPSRLDVIFAFASLLHVPKESLQKILRDGFDALLPGGVFRISLKCADEYTERTQNDEFGTRTFYLYSEADLREMTEGFEWIAGRQSHVQGSSWLEVLLRKPL